MSALHQPALRPGPLRTLGWLLAAGVACSGAAADWSGASRERGERDRSSRQSRAAQLPRLGIGQKFQCRVARVADGDTIRCRNGERVRLLLIDAPELSQGAAGQNAKRILETLLPVGTDATIETDVRTLDQYDRVLGYVYLPDGRMANEEMARSGYVTALVYPPNVRYVERIRRAVSEARNARRGLWATDFFACSPRDYRAGRCGGGPPQSRR